MKSILNEKNILNYIKKNYSSILNKKMTDDQIISIYWFDNNMKNILFPWILKIERELKTIFVYFFKKKYKSFKDIILNENNFDNQFKKITPILNKIKKYDSLEEFIFSITYGEFIKIIKSFNSDIYKSIIKSLNIEKIDDDFFKKIQLIRNNIAHNLSLLSINEITINDCINLIYKYLNINDTLKSDIFMSQCQSEISKIKNII